MRILAIDSSSLVASVAVVTDDILTAEYTINFKKTHSQTLLPMIDEISKMIELNMDTIDAIAITGGPGSFTGLRIGSATAKGFGLALNKPIINVPTIDAMAYNFYTSNYIICPIMDARRCQVYTGIYSFEQTKMKVLKEQCAISVEDLIVELDKIGKTVMFLGDGVPAYREIIDEKMQTNHVYAPCHMNRQRASSVAALAQIYYENGQIEEAREHRPDYLRLSQAEREMIEKQKNR